MFMFVFLRNQEFDFTKRGLKSCRPSHWAFQNLSISKCDEQFYSKDGRVRAILKPKFLCSKFFVHENKAETILFLPRKN